MLGFGLFGFIHLPHSWVTMPSESIKGVCNCCFTVLVVHCAYNDTGRATPKSRVINVHQQWLRVRQQSPVCARGRDSFLHQRSSGSSGKAQTLTIVVLDRHWCCCRTGHSKPPMQHEKRRLWGVQGCFLTLLAFVRALSELWGFSAQKGRVWSGLNTGFMHLYA